MRNFSTFSLACLFHFTVHRCTKLFGPKVKQNKQASKKVGKISQISKGSFRGQIRLKPWQRKRDSSQQTRQEMASSSAETEKSGKIEVSSPGGISSEVQVCYD